MRLEYGGIAQLGERLNGIQEVSGSIPLISTKSREFYSNSRLFLCFYKQKLLWSCFMPIQDCLLDLLYFTGKSSIQEVDFYGSYYNEKLSNGNFRTGF